MAQNECQQMDKTGFYQNLRNQLSTFYNGIMALQRASEFLNTMDEDTASNMTMQAQTVVDVANLRTAINEILAFYSGSATSQSKVLKDEINKMRYI
jgi:hypothetical protein